MTLNELNEEIMELRDQLLKKIELLQIHANKEIDLLEKQLIAKYEEFNRNLPKPCSNQLLKDMILLHLQIAIKELEGTVGKNMKFRITQAIKITEQLNC